MYLNPFVSPPYLKCPKCQEPFFGVLSIGKNSYNRRCAKCEYPRGTEPPAQFPLPELKKKIIYLDQFVISNMVKALHPRFSKVIPDFYIKAFEKLDRLSKLQLIVCPDSQFHENESLFSKFPKEHKRVYELLSHGVSYWDQWTIFRFQVMEHLEKWITGKDDGETNFTAHRFTNGEIDTWQDRLLISINSQRLEANKLKIKEEKIHVFELFKQALMRWEREKDKTFDSWYEEEVSQWKNLLAEGYQIHFKRMMEFMLNPQSIDPLTLIPSPFYLTFDTISKCLQKKSSSETEYTEKLNSFLSAPSIEKVPFIRILSTIFAMTAHRISKGNMRVEKIKSSFFTDANMVATILPFCDAIFLERQMAGFLRDAPLNSVLTKMPRVFSLSNQDDFFSYLDDIENTAPSGHLQTVREVYGDEWGQPYTTVLKDEI